MKRLKTICLVTLLGLLMGNCVKDEGSYDYTEVNDVVISGIEELYEVNMLDTLRISPDLEGTLGPIDESNYEFLWDIFEGLNSPQRFPEPDSLSTERDLDIVVTHIPDNYRVNLKVTDKTTQVRYRYQFDLRVYSEFQRGLLVLSEVDGNAVVSMISVTGDVYTNLYHTINGEHAGTNPLYIDMMGRAPLDYVAIICGDERGGVFASSVSFAKIYEYSDYFYNPPEVINPQYFNTTRSYGMVTDYQVFVNRSFVVNDGKLHLKDLNHNVTTDEGVVTVENLFYDAYPGDYENAPQTFWMVDNIHFDQLNQRFMYIPRITQPNLYPVPEDPENEYFDPANLGMDFVWGRMVPSPRGQTLVNSLFRRDNGMLSFLRWRANFPAAGRVHQIQKIDFPDDWAIQDATTFAGNLRHDYIFFGTGSKIYVFDRVANQEREVFDFGGNVVVDNLHYHEAIRSEQIMYVSTSIPGQGGMSGSVHEMAVAPGGMLSISESFENIAGRVVDTTWKN